MTAGLPNMTIIPDGRRIGCMPSRRRSGNKVDRRPHGGNERSTVEADGSGLPGYAYVYEAGSLDGYPGFDRVGPKAVDFQHIGVKVRELRASVDEASLINEGDCK